MVSAMLYISAAEMVGGADGEPEVRGADGTGVAVERAYVGPDARWVTSSERGVTYAASPPQGRRRSGADPGGIKAECALVAGFRL